MSVDVFTLTKMFAEKLPYMNEQQLETAENELNEVIKYDCESSLASLVKLSWHLIEPGTKLIWNWHLDVLCAYLEAVFYRKIKRVIFNVPPGSMKSSIVSVAYPVWCWIKRPEERFLNITNEQGLALRDALKSKTIIQSDWFQSKWDLPFDPSQNEKILYQNVKRGFRQSLGITAGITGKRGSTLIIDDPHDSMQVESDLQRQTVIDAYDYKLSTRLNNPKEDAIILIMQRLHQADLTGHLLTKKKVKWVHVCIPMEYEGVQGFDAGRDIGRPDLIDPRTKDGELFFEERFDRKTVNALKEDLGSYGSAGQLQQRPSPKGGGILKMDWWRIWPDDKPLPHCEHIFTSWDTAYSEEDLKNNSYSAMTQWGVFWHEQRQKYCLLLLKAWAGQINYPDLRKKAKKIDYEQSPDAHLIEKKASGQSLVQDLKQARIRVRTYQPDRDKVARAYSVSAMFESGQVYAPNRRWADKVIDYAAQFPNGASPSSDFTDTITQALLYLRNGWWVSHPDDDNDFVNGQEGSENRHIPEDFEDFEEEDPMSSVGGAYG